MSKTQDEEFVKYELMEMIAAAMDAGFAEFVGFDVTDGVLTAESYDEAGNVTGSWEIDIVVRSVEGSGS